VSGLDPWRVDIRAARVGVELFGLPHARELRSGAVGRRSRTTTALGVALAALVVPASVVAPAQSWAASTVLHGADLRWLRFRIGRPYVV